MISPIQMDIISITTIVAPEAVLLKPLHMNHLDQGSKHNDCMIIVLESYDYIVGTDQPKLKYMYYM